MIKRNKISARLDSRDVTAWLTAFPATMTDMMTRERSPNVDVVVAQLSAILGFFLLGRVAHTLGQARAVQTVS